jgi:hypothetical protein
LLPAAPRAAVLQATPFERMQWTVLNSAISLLGYWAAAALVDKPWCACKAARCVRGRRLC